MNEGDTTRYQVDKRLVKAAFNTAAPHYDGIAVLQREVRERMLERLGLVKISPQCVVDVGAGTGHAAFALAQRYTQATVISIDIAWAMLSQARVHAPRLQRWRKRHRWICGDAEKLPLRDACADLIFSNLTLQWCPNVDQTFRELRRTLRPNGLVMFSTFGPDTLRELRQCWRQVDGHNHVNAFIDMHDIGDSLIRSGFSDPVMDVETFTLTYPDAAAVMRELKTLGAHNVTAGRNRGLTTPRKLRAVTDGYEKLRQAGTLPATFEVVYGHAWYLQKESRAKQPRGEVHIAVDTLRRPR